MTWNAFAPTHWSLLPSSFVIRIHLLLDQALERVQRFDARGEFAGDLAGGPGVGVLELRGFVGDIVIGLDDLRSRGRRFERDGYGPLLLSAPLVVKGFVRLLVLGAKW